MNPRTCLAMILAAVTVPLFAGQARRSPPPEATPPKAAEAPRIVSDGDFRDWESVPIALRDPVDAPGSKVDFGEVRVTADSRFLSVMVDLGEGRDQRSLAGPVVLLLDADHNAATGEPMHGLDGVDLVIETPFPSSPGYQVRRFYSPAVRTVEAAEAIGLTVAPTYASARVEVRVERGSAPDRSVPLPASSAAPSLTAGRALLKFVYLEGGSIKDQTAAVEVALPPFVPATPPSADARVPAMDPIARAPGTQLRVVVWNVAGFPDRSRIQEARREPLAKTLSALDADLLLLNEVSAKSVARIEPWLPRTDGGRTPWRLSLKGEVVIAARGSVDEVFDRPPLPPATGFYATFAELFIWGRSTVAAAGALVAIGNRRVLATPLHLACCGAEDERLIQAPVLRDAVKRALPGARADAVIIGGDFNLLRSREPLEVLRRGLDPDGSALAIAEALQLDGLANFTWRSTQGNSPNVPGRLDWLTYSGSSLELLRTFVFDGANLAPYWLRHHGLDAEQTRTTSDHLPIVADFRWRR